MKHRLDGEPPIPFVRIQHFWENRNSFSKDQLQEIVNRLQRKRDCYDKWANAFQILLNNLEEGKKV